MTPDTSGAPLHSKKETTFSWGCVRSSGRCRSGGVLRSARACNSFILGVWRKPLDGRDQVLARCLLPMLWMNLEEGIYIYIYTNSKNQQESATHLPQVREHLQSATERGLKACFIAIFGDEEPQQRMEKMVHNWVVPRRLSRHS